MEQSLQYLTVRAGDRAMVSTGQYVLRVVCNTDRGKVDSFFFREFFKSSIKKVRTDNLYAELNISFESYTKRTVLMNISICHLG